MTITYNAGTAGKAIRSSGRFRVLRLIGFGSGECQPYPESSPAPRSQPVDPDSRFPIPDIDVTSQTKKTHTETANPNHLKMIQAANR
jgi:hypothetical protein